MYCGCDKCTVSWSNLDQIKKTFYYWLLIEWSVMYKIKTKNWNVQSSIESSVVIGYNRIWALQLYTTVSLLF